MDAGEHPGGGVNEPDTPSTEALSPEAIALAEWVCDNPSKVLTLAGSRELYVRLSRIEAEAEHDGYAKGYMARSVPTRPDEPLTVERLAAALQATDGMPEAEHRARAILAALGTGEAE